MTTNKNPPAVGVYKTDNGYQNWNGKFWGSYAATSFDAFKKVNSDNVSQFQTPVWVAPEWYTETPTEIGVYQTYQVSSVATYQYFNGEFWGMYMGDIQSAEKYKDKKSCIQNPKWKPLEYIETHEKKEQTMKIETGKFYLTRSGLKVEILKTDVVNNDDEAIIVLFSNNQIFWYYADGSYLNDEQHDYDLVSEYSSWSDVAVDTKVYVKPSSANVWTPRHFCKFEEGKVYAFVEGKTSFITDSSTSWDDAKLAE
jgi:hypothetical protein